MDDQNEICVVCMNTLDNDDSKYSMKQCNHKFHKNCIDQWLIQDSRCPICRTVHRYPIPIKYYGNYLFPIDGKKLLTSYSKIIDIIKYSVFFGNHNRSVNGVFNCDNKKITIETSGKLKKTQPIHNLKKMFNIISINKSDKFTLDLQNIDHVFSIDKILMVSQRVRNFTYRIYFFKTSLSQSTSIFQQIRDVCEHKNNVIGYRY